MGYIKFVPEVTGCNSCYNNEACRSGENYNIINKCCDMKRGLYCHLHDLEAMVEWAEDKCRESGGLIACLKKSECRHSNECTSPAVMLKVDTSKSEDKPEEVKEYVVVNVISMDSLNESELITDKDFRELFTTWHQDWFIDNILDNKADIWCSRHCLLEAGFIAEKVHDPVVSLGETFVNENGKKYKIIDYVNEGEYLLMIELESGLQTRRGPQENDGKLTLSDFTGKDIVKYYKPCKIKITEVKD